MRSCFFFTDQKHSRHVQLKTPRNPPQQPPPQGDECLVRVFKSLNSPRHDKDIPFQTPFKGNVARHCQGHVSIPPSLKPRREIWLRADRTGCFSLRPGVSRFRHEENEWGVFGWQRRVWPTLWFKGALNRKSVPNLKIQCVEFFKEAHLTVHSVFRATVRRASLKKMQDGI